MSMRTVVGRRACREVARRMRGLAARATSLPRGAVASSVVLSLLAILDGSIPRIRLHASGR